MFFFSESKSSVNGIINQEEAKLSFYLVNGSDDSPFKLLLSCHGRPSLKMGFVFLFFFSSREKLQFLRNIACIRLNNDAAAV